MTNIYKYSHNGPDIYFFFFGKGVNPGKYITKKSLSTNGMWLKYHINLKQKLDEQEFMTGHKHQT